MSVKTKMRSLIATMSALGTLSYFVLKSKTWKKNVEQTKHNSQKTRTAKYNKQKVNLKRGKRNEKK